MKRKHLYICMFIYLNLIIFPQDIYELVKEEKLSKIKDIEIKNYNINKKYYLEGTLLDIAVKNNNVELVSYFLKNPNIFKSTINEAYLVSQNIEITKILLKKGAEINYINEFSALMNLNGVIRSNNQNDIYELMEFLLKNGANPNLQDNQGNTCLFNLYESVDYITVVGELYLTYRANMEIKNKNGETVLLDSVRFIEDERTLIEFLLEKGANPYVLNNKGEDVFDLAKSEEMKKLLKRYTVDYRELFEIISSYKDNKNIELTLEKLEKSNVRTLVKFNKPKYFTITQYVSVLNDYAYFLSETDRYKEAIPILERVIELSPNRVVVYLNLGDCYYKDYKKSKKQSDKEKVVENYKKYVSLLKKDTKIPDRVKEILEIK